MNCRKVSYLLSAYIDGELPGVEHRQVHEHLAQCTECSGEYAGLLRTKRLLSALRVQEPRPELPGTILQQIEARETHAPLSGLARFRQWSVTLGSPRLATQYIVCGVGLTLLAVFCVARFVDDDASNTVKWYPNNVSTALPLPAAPAASPSVPFKTWPSSLGPSVLDVSTPPVYQVEPPPSKSSPFRQIGPSGLPQWPLR